LLSSTFLDEATGNNFKHCCDSDTTATKPSHNIGKLRIIVTDKLKKHMKVKNIT